MSARRLLGAGVVVAMLAGCMSAPRATEPEEQAPGPRTMKAGYAEPACQAIASFSLISAVGLPMYLVVSGFANRACSELQK